MDGSLGSIINLYEFTTGRRIFTHQQVRAAAKAEGFTPLEKHCDVALAHDQQTLALERRWATEPAGGKANPEAQRMDVLVDRTLGAVRDHAVAQTQGAAPDDAIHADVESFLKRLFPTGVQDVIHKPFIEELAAVDEIVGLLQGELAPQVKEFGLGRLTKRLAALATEYRAALEAPPPSLVQWGRVRAARAEGQGMLLETVAIILGKHHARTPEGTDKRLSLLGPVVRQNEAIGQYLRARRAVSDVNPETGQDEAAPPEAKKEG